MELVTVFQTFNQGEAQLITSRLEAAGFPVHLAQEISASTGYPTSNGILVQVPDDQATDARALIASTEDSPE